jgi:hypothetical protein
MLAHMQDHGVVKDKIYRADQRWDFEHVNHLRFNLESEGCLCSDKVCSVLFWNSQNISCQFKKQNKIE